MKIKEYDFKPTWAELEKEYPQVDAAYFMILPTGRYLVGVFEKENIVEERNGRARIS